MQDPFRDSRANSVESIGFASYGLPAVPPGLLNACEMKRTARQLANQKTRTQVCL
jgi:hypothetical protein